MDRAWILVSRFLGFVVPGIGIMSSPWAKSHARAKAPTATPFDWAISSNASTTFRFFREIALRKSGKETTNISFWEIISRFEMSCQEPSTKRSITDPSYTKLTTCC